MKSEDENKVIEAFKVLNEFQVNMKDTIHKIGVLLGLQQAANWMQKYIVEEKDE